MSRIEWTGTARRSTCFIFGVVVPPICFSLDPFFFARNGLPGQLPDWPLFDLATTHSTLAYTAYGLLAIGMLGMCLHCMVPYRLTLRLERPALVIGMLFSAFFSVAIVPILPFCAMLFWLLLPLLAFAPICSFIVFLWAYRHSMRDVDAFGHAHVWLAAGVVLALCFLPHLHYTSSVESLEQAWRPSELAPALERVARYRGLAREDLRRIYLAAQPLKQLRMRNLYYEITERPLFDLIADDRL